jgi:hypothetical protein
MSPRDDMPVKPPKDASFDAVSLYLDRKHHSLSPSLVSWQSRGMLRGQADAGLTHPEWCDLSECCAADDNGPAASHLSRWTALHPARPGDPTVFLRLLCPSFDLLEETNVEVELLVSHPEGTSIQGYLLTAPMFAALVDAVSAFRTVTDQPEHWLVPLSPAGDPAPAVEVGPALKPTAAPIHSRPVTRWVRLDQGADAGPPMWWYCRVVDEGGQLRFQLVVHDVDADSDPDNSDAFVRDSIGLDRARVLRDQLNTYLALVDGGEPR